MLISRDINWNHKPWLWYTNTPTQNTYAIFYHQFDSSDLSSFPWLALACNGRFQVWLNHKLVHCGPCREVAPFIGYDVLDLSTYVIQGTNELKLIVHYAGIATQSGESVQAGILLTGKINEVDLSNPSAWICRQERRQLPSWRLGSCLGWAEQVQLHSEFHTETLEPILIDRFPNGPCTIPITRSIPALGGEHFTAHYIGEIQDGFLFDFKQEVLGLIQLHLHASTDSMIDICYAEALSDGQVWHQKMNMDYRDRLHLSPGMNTWQSFEVRAGRYVCIHGSGISQITLSVIEQHYPFNPAQLPRNAQDREICVAAARTITLCTEDIQSDCPWRERAQYLDPYAYINAMQILFQDLNPIKKWLRQLARGAEDRGYLPMCYPSKASNSVIPDFQAVYALALHRYWTLTRDIETLTECYPAACLAIKDLSKGKNADGLLDQVPGWLFIDNSFHLPRRPASSALNAYYAGALHALSQIATALSLADEASTWQDEFLCIRSLYRRSYLNDTTLRDSLIEPDSLIWWNHHANAAGITQKQGYLVLDGIVNNPSRQALTLSIAHYAHCMLYIDGELIYNEQQHGGWSNPPLDWPRITTATIQRQCQLRIIYAYSSIDWEVYIGASETLEWQHTKMQLLDKPESKLSEYSWQNTEWRPYARPRLSQVSVGLAAQHGMLEEQEAQELLRSCLVEKHFEPWAKRTTPFFVEISTDRHQLVQNVLPSNTPWALYPFCCALRQYGMLNEAQHLIRNIYQHMLDKDASTFWEEWGTSSSLCHAWSAFVAEFLIDSDY